MLTIRELIKTLYNAFIQKLKKHRGNWEQNDPTADDYIKNRPFYIDGYTSVIKNETFRTYDDGELCSPFSFKPVVGEVYKVTWNEKEYECIAFGNFGNVCIGNKSLVTDAKNTGEPFFYFYYEEDDYKDYELIVKNAGTHTVSIDKLNVKKIDKKFVDMPDTVSQDMLAPVAFTGNYWDLNSTPIVYTDVIRYDSTQSLTSTQKTRARTNIGAIGYESQSLTEAQKTQARTNIGAASSADYVIDSALSVNSNNPVKNAVITTELNQIKNAKADWNQKNTTALDYIKNRPFYEDVTESYVSIIYNPVASNYDSSLGYYYEFLPGSSPGIHNNFTYRVTLSNGLTLTTICKKGRSKSGDIYNYVEILGNPIFAKNYGIIETMSDGSPVVDSGENWCFISYDYTAMAAILSTISDLKIDNLYRITTTLKTINEKFIPETIARIDNIDEQIVNKLNRTGAVNAADTNYTTYMARGTSLNSTETNPTINGTIAWTYE